MGVTKWLAQACAIPLAVMWFFVACVHESARVLFVRSQQTPCVC
jgi:hypothetical protein